MYTITINDGYITPVLRASTCTVMPATACETALNSLNGRHLSLCTWYLTPLVSMADIE